ncbi:integrin beta-like protein A [Amphiura filiformis]|uniref:integrin beta-like protein A n=1 Tax=Amphiura filiformis TaxID=82378 RepID=UPI003B227454
MEIYVTTVLLLQLLGATYGTHFRGGTMSWRPTGVGNQVEVTYKLSNNGFRIGDSLPPSGHQTCDQAAKDSKQMLTTTGYMYCVGCETLYYRDMQWVCTDFNEEASWDIGQDSFNITVPDVNQKVSIYHERCCWVDNLRNAPTNHPQQGYKMMTDIDLRPRLDNGQMNSSPVTAAIPVQQFHSGCIYHLEIPVTDPDDDPYRCRYTRGWDDECYNENRGKYGDICFALSYITVYENCTLEFDTSGGPGYYAVRVMIEDLDQNGDPMSFISMSFLLYVHPDSTTCEVPTIKQPLDGCKTIPVGEPYEQIVVVESASAELPIKRIETSKPPGMTVSPIANMTGNPLQKYVTLNWIPTKEMIGKQSIGINAVDNGGFVSGWSFLVLNVADVPPLQPVPDESTPSPGAEINADTKWVVTFNTEVQRPSVPAFISLLDINGDIVDVCDVSNEDQAKFTANQVTFSLSGGTLAPGTHEYRLVVDPVAALTNEVNEYCPLYSLPATWNILLKGPDKPITTVAPPAPKTVAPPGSVTVAPPAPAGPPAPQHGPYNGSAGQSQMPTFKCISATASVTTNAPEGAVCFIHLETSHATVTAGGLRVPYKLCCPADCSRPTVIPPVQPESESEITPGYDVASGDVNEAGPETPEAEKPQKVTPDGGAITTEGPVTPPVDGMGPVGQGLLYDIMFADWLSD